MNKKLGFFAVGTMIIGSSAFASNYSCDVLKDQGGHAILGGPAYAVAVSEDGIVLEVTSGADEGGALSTVDFEMKKVAQMVEGATYSADGVTASIMFNPLTHGESVGISTHVGGELVSADCALTAVTEADSAEATSKEKISDWNDGTTRLTITGESASIQFACGAISIEKGWNTEGRPMDGVDKGGPVMVGPGTPVTVTAVLKDGKLVVHTGEGSDSQYVFTPGAGKSTGLICL